MSFDKYENEFEKSWRWIEIVWGSGHNELPEKTTSAGKAMAKKLEDKSRNKASI